MGTALLYPNDCLAPSWSHANPRFEPAVLKTESVLVPGDAEIGFSGRRRPRGSSGGCGALGGLLPLPGHDPSAAIYSFAFGNNANLRSPRGQITSQRSVPYPRKRCRFPASTEYQFATTVPSPESPLRDAVLNNFLRCRRPSGLRIATPQTSQGAPAASVNSASFLHSQGCLSPKNTNHQLGANPQLNCRNPASEPSIFISAPLTADRGNVNGQPSRSPSCMSAQGNVDQAILTMYPSFQQPLRVGKTETKKHSCSNTLISPSPLSVANTGKSVAVADLNQPCKYTEDGTIVSYNDILKSPPSDDTGRSERRAHGLLRKAYNRSNSGCCSWTSKSNDGHGRLDSTYDLFMAAVAERWAGPSFFNSPHPSALPVPSFASKLLRTCSSVTSGADDAAFATKQLRRILHLDHLT